MYTKYVSSKDANVKLVQNRKPLARAIALALMAGCVAVPAGAWAATLQGQRFLSSSSNTTINGEPLYTARSYIAFKLLNNPQLTQLTAPVRGNYTIVLPDGDYEVWQFADPAVLTTTQFNQVQWADTGNTNQVLKITVAGSTITWTDTDSPVANNTIDFPFPDWSSSPPIPSAVNSECDVTDATNRRVICAAGAVPPGGIGCNYTHYSLTSPWPGVDLASLFATKRVFIYGELAVSSYGSGVMAKVTSLCNHGTLVSDGNQDIKIRFQNGGVFANFEDGEIIGADAPANSNQPGASITLDNASLAVNLGTIQAGNASTHNLLNSTQAQTFSQSSSLGGNVKITASNTYQYGDLFAGQGSEIRFSDCRVAWYWEHYAGNAVFDDFNTSINLLTPSYLAGNAMITGGPVAFGNSSSSSGGIGGSVVIDNTNFNDIYCMSVNEIEGGTGGTLSFLVNGVSTSGNPALKGSSVYVEPDTIEISGNTTITADEDVVIFGGDNYLLRMTTLQENAITAGRNIVLAVGSGGTIDLRGISTKAFKAGGNIEIYADNIVLDEDVVLEDLVGAGVIVRGGNKIIYHAVFSGSQWVAGKVGETVPIQLTLHNGGPKSDTYTFAVTSKNGSTVNGLPATVTIDGLKRADLNLNVTLPTEGNDVITVTATSQADSTVVATTQVQAAVEKPEVVEPEKVALTLTKSGEGTLTAQGIDCGTDCTETYDINTEVKLTATPANGYQFANWSGDCASDTVTMDQAKTCVANFTMLRYTASGKLFAEPNMPLAGATIHIGDKTAVTDKLGYWKIEGLTNGTYTATATKNGHTIPSQQVVINGENLTFDLGVVYSAYGTIKDEQKQPVAGITITIGDKHTQTDAVGYWKIEGLPAGESTLIASKDGYKFAPAKFVLGDQEPNKELLVTPASTLVMTAKPSPWQAIRQGANVTYTYTLLNGGELTATGVTFTETVPKGAKLVSLTAKDGGDCDAATLTCTLPDLTAGATAQVELVLQATDGNSLKNTATASANEYPTDVQTSYKTVKPHLSVTVTDSPNPVVMLTDLHYTATVELSPLAPEDTAKDINLVMQLPKGLELKAVTAAAGTCDSSQFPLISCQLPNLSIATPDSVSQTAVNVDVTLKDAGLLVLTNEAKVTASNYPAHTVREKTNIFIPDTIKIDLAIVMDTTNSMQDQINGVKSTIDKLIATVDASQRPTMALIEFKDDVRVKAFTQDTEVMLGAVAKLVAEGGGTCPEASAEALEVALKHVKDGGTVMLITDASPYPEANLENLAALIKSKNMKFNALITGDCTGEGDLNEMTK